MSFSESFPGFRLRLTRWGLVYLVTSVVLGMAAVNTGNNALMAVLGLALGSYVISGIWSRQVLGNIRATIELPSEIYAGRPAVIGVGLENTSRFLPAYGLVVRDSDGRTVIHEPLLVTMGRRRHSVELVFPDRGRHEIGAWRLDVLLQVESTDFRPGGARLPTSPANVLGIGPPRRWAAFPGCPRVAGSGRRGDPTTGLQRG